MSDTPDVQFIESVVKLIVENPQDIKVERNVDEMGVLITLEVGKEDMGKVIGKDGKTAKALRTLLRIIGSRNNARINLKIVEPGGADAEQPRMQSNSNDNHADIDADLDL
ncbi:RNA-binding protein [Candidatus Peregrinibacteria bacterium HGW-Peregrinibacteria-1]|jgi:hypothetical protein|nr:MAG: RNA-binding protein [Candidatus Peregrinibacteria bacterium HGW-Peregrinibacteria-1]